MRRRRSQPLVIDASVACAAGGVDAGSISSRNSREVLLAVYRICHRVVRTPRIRAEWKEHQSAFARTWLRWMTGARKVERTSEDESLPVASRILAATPRPAERKAMAKDLHLIEAALATGAKIIVSRDEAARQAFLAASGKVREVLDSGQAGRSRAARRVDWVRRRFWHGSCRDDQRWAYQSVPMTDKPTRRSVATTGKGRTRAAAGPSIGRGSGGLIRAG